MKGNPSKMTDNPCENDIYSHIRYNGLYVRAEMYVYSDIYEGTLVFLIYVVFDMWEYYENMALHYLH